jgi:hypothetical protein
VLDKIAAKYGHTFLYTDVKMGGEAIDAYGDPLPQQELDKCLAADSVLLGAVGGPKWEGMPGEKRPEKGLLRLRAGMGLYSNTRPAKDLAAAGAGQPPEARNRRQGHRLCDRARADGRRLLRPARDGHAAKRRKAGRRLYALRRARDRAHRPHRL